jgi:hypothetical protein
VNTRRWFIVTGDLISAESGGSERSGENGHLHRDTGRDALGRVEIEVEVVAANLNAICDGRRRVSVLQVRDEISNALLGAFPEEPRCHEIVKLPLHRRSK